MYLHASSQVHEEPNEEVQHGGAQGSVYSMSSAASLGPDKDGEVVDQREYRSMIGSLLYLTATRPDFQDSPRSSHWTAVQRVFRYLKHTLEFEI
jgi:hypothetical protein